MPFDTVLLGNPSEEILNFSKKKKVDFIVVGSLGKGMISRPVQEILQVEEESVARKGAMIASHDTFHCRP